MAFVDEVSIHAAAGRGGDGVVRWLHLKGKDRAGPAGGDGGRGGDVILEGVRDLAALATYRFTKKFRAEHGGPGEGNNKHGKDGEPDRKSTRLNSSHSSTSYAVFCLKKNVRCTAASFCSCPVCAVPTHAGPSE